tara:strand:- start:7266 stop:7691 length:426 start_codon:yes stop_codon:yes gene_type:complete
MKTLLITFIFLLSGVSNLFAQKKETVTVIIEVSVTKYNKGNILLALYNSEEAYMEDVYKSADVLIKENKAIIIFDEVEKGVYAFSLFHDINENKKLDTNFLGIPKEPYGFSNGERGRFGPPKFKEATFNITKNETLKVSIK